MEMSLPLQIVLFIAALAVIVLVACILPIAFKMRLISEDMVCAIKEFKEDVHFIKEQAEVLMQNLDELSRRATCQMDDVTQIIRTARQWTERADRIVEQVEPPVFAMARNLNLMRAGVGKFLQVFLHSNHRKPNHEEIEDE